MCYGMGCMWEDSYGECRYPNIIFLAEEGCVCVEEENLDKKEEEEEEEEEDEE